jgi:hypothetical protein
MTSPAAASAFPFQTGRFQVSALNYKSRFCFSGAGCNSIPPPPPFPPALCAMVTVTWNVDIRDSQPVSLYIRTSQGTMSRSQPSFPSGAISPPCRPGLMMHPNTGIPYNGPHQPIVCGPTSRVIFIVVTLCPCPRFWLPLSRRCRPHFVQCVLQTGTRP